MSQSNFPDLLPSFATLVMAGLVIYLWLTVNRLHRAVKRLEDRLASAPPPLPVPPPAPATPAQAPTPAVRPAPEPEGIDEGILTAIAAAVAVVVRQPHRIIAIQPDASAQRAWSAEGRRELYHSHKIR